MTFELDTFLEFLTVSNFINQQMDFAELPWNIVH